MIKESLISLYLYVYKICFSFFKLFSLKDKTVFLSTFGENAYFIANELSHSKAQQLIFINQKRCKIDFSSIPTENKKIYSFETWNFFDTLFGIYHLATSKHVFVDNYFGVLSVMDFREKVKCIQLWHATGAIKKFGWGVPETEERSEKAKRRFQQVYDRFQYIPVGSKQMSKIFSESFRLDPSRFLFTGVPQTDFYFDNKAKAHGLNRVKEKYPAVNGKKVVLYAPTYRNGFFDKVDIQLNIQDFLDQLDDNYLLMIRLHPSIQEAAQVPDHPRVILVNDYPHINELLLISDILITDYSSIPFDFSFLRKKMIFFAYDLEAYNQTQGLWAESDLYFPGPIVKTTTEVINHIIDPIIDFESIDHFKEHWNAFSAGNSSIKLVKQLYGKEDY